jgi:hypothetical protein
MSHPLAVKNLEDTPIAELGPDQACGLTTFDSNFRGRHRHSLRAEMIRGAHLILLPNLQSEECFTVAHGVDLTQETGDATRPRRVVSGWFTKAGQKNINLTHEGISPRGGI